jgi:teichuronic acid exporter
MDKKTSLIKNLAWDYSAKMLTQLLAFVVSIILARILGPSDYGVVAAATIFSTICTQIVGGGFGIGLIQKKESDAKDFSAMLYFHFGLGIILFAIVFFAAPYIEGFFQFDNLSLILRLLSIQIPFAAINAIGNAYLSKRLEFKKYSIVSAVATITAGLAGLLCAFLHFGPFSLVVQYVGTTVITTILLIIVIRKKPLLFFSFKRIKFYLSFGWKILVTGLLDTLYNDIKSLVLGKMHSSSELAFNNKGAMIPSMVVTNVNQTLMSVLFPYLSNEKDDVKKMSSIVTECILCSTFFIFPAMIGLAVLARPIVLLLLGNAWSATAPYLVLYAISFLGSPIYLLLEQGIKSLGNGKTILNLGIIKTAFGIALVVLCVFVFTNPLFIAGASIVSVVFDDIVLIIASKKYLKIDYSLFFKELLNNLAIAMLMGAIVYCLGGITTHNWINIIIQVTIGIILYFLLASLLQNKQYIFIKSTLANFLKRKKQ